MRQNPWAVALIAAVAAAAPLAAAGTAGAAIAPNGAIAYDCYAEEGGAPDICTLDPETGVVANLTNDEIATDSWPTWSPDGTQIAFQVDHAIQVMNADGSGRRPLTGSFQEPSFHPAWSPDGTRIAFVSTRGGTDYEIYTVAATGETPASPATRLTTTPRDEADGIDDFQPAWSPDSARIAFVSESRAGAGACDVWAMDSVDRNGDGNGDAIARLTAESSTSCQAFRPAWSPAGDLIAFASTRTGNAEVFVMSPDGSAQRNATNHPDADLYPGWSPDGTQVTFTSGRDGDDDIYSLAVADIPAPVATASAARRARASQAAPTPVRQLTHNDTPDALAAWGASSEDADPVTAVTAPSQSGVLSHKTKAPLARGTVADDRGVASVSVALRERRRDGRCEWWTGRNWRRAGCGARTWLRATGTAAWSWRMPRLQKTNGSRRDYTLYARATDSAGQVEQALAAGRNAITFTVGK